MTLLKDIPGYWAWNIKWMSDMVRQLCNHGVGFTFFNYRFLLSWFFLI